jgi:hypothetical protein
MSVYNQAASLAGSNKIAVKLKTQLKNLCNKNVGGMICLNRQ